MKTENGQLKIFFNEEQIIKQDEVFDLINDAHIRLGHAGRNILYEELKNFRGISKYFHYIFLNNKFKSN